MRTLALSALLLASSVPAEAGDPCRKVTEVDEETGLQVNRASGYTVLPEWGLATWDAEWQHGMGRFTHRARAPGLHEAIVPAGTLLVLVQDDGQVHNLELRTPARPVHHEDGAGGYTEWPLSVAITPSQVEALAVSPIRTLQVALPPGEANWEVVSSRKMQRALACFASLP